MNSRARFSVAAAILAIVALSCESEPRYENVELSREQKLAQVEHIKKLLEECERDTNRIVGRKASELAELLSVADSKKEDGDTVGYFFHKGVDCFEGPGHLRIFVSRSAGAVTEAEIICPEY